MSKTTPNPIKPENASTIVTKGMYRFSRNPMYLGLFFWLMAWAIYLSVLSPFLLLPAFVWVLTVQQIIPEEKILEEKFGDSYTNYKKQVGRWI
jgi:protein-S-isoprenylcysteine O-methyltransferase Ste14